MTKLLNVISRPAIKLTLTSVLAILILASCGSSRKAIDSSNTAYSPEKKENKNQKDEKRSDLPKISQDLVNEARKWIGTPYKYGGQDRKGADCSGFVMQVYKTVTGISLPRNSAEQCNFCRPIDKKELNVGDLIFFSSQASSGKVAHVGMYIGSGVMIHASSSKGVIESSIESDYYIRHYLCSGHVEGLNNRSDSKFIENLNKTETIVIVEEEEVEQKPAPLPEDIVKNAFKR